MVKFTPYAALRMARGDTAFPPKYHIFFPLFFAIAGKIETSQQRAVFGSLKRPPGGSRVAGGGH